MTDTIRNNNTFRQVLPYADLSGVFPRNIRPQDIDGEVEINGHFLWLEWKREAAEFTGGQWLATFKRLWLMKRRATLLIVYHDTAPEAETVEPGDVYGLQLARWDQWLQTHGDAIRVTPYFHGNYGKLKTVCHEWRLHAEERPNDFVTAWRAKGPHGEYPITLTQTQL